MEGCPLSIGTCSIQRIIGSRIIRQIWLMALSQSLMSFHDDLKLSMRVAFLLWLQALGHPNGSLLTAHEKVEIAVQYLVKLNCKSVQGAVISFQLLQMHLFTNRKSSLLRYQLDIFVEFLLRYRPGIYQSPAAGGGIFEFTSTEKYCASHKHLG